MKFSIFSLLVFLSLLSSFLLSFPPISLASPLEVDDESRFSYEEGTSTGPENWGKIDPHWRICNEGKFQSPIDLGFVGKEVQIAPNLGKLKRNYKPAPALIKNRGHDIVVFWKGDAGGITINGTYYNLTQCHWHSPSEHTFKGSRFSMELHIVHTSSEGKMAVIGIMYKRGRPDTFLNKLLAEIKALEDKVEEREIGIVNPGNIKFGSRKYFRYIGSLTVPPCTQGIIWTIVDKVRTVSIEQLTALRAAVHDGFEENARPTQKQEGRTVWMYTPR